MRFSLLPTAILAAGASALPANNEVPRALGDVVDVTPFKTTGFAPVKIDQSKFAAAKNAGTLGSGNSAVSASAMNLAGCPPRIEWRRLSDSDRRAFVGAIRCLQNRPSAGGFPGAQNRWDDLASVHQRMTPNVHMTQAFLPWHRYYLAIFESLIRDECGYRGPMTWWDETQDAGNFRNSPVFRDEYFGTLPVQQSNGDGYCVNSGTFAGLTLHIGPGPGNSDHCLSRGVDENETAECNQGFVDYVNSFGNYDDMEWWAERGPHAWGHNGIGPVMTDVYGSPGDPVFFLHHGFIDRNWYRWQNADPANRMYTLGSMSTGGTFGSFGLRGDVRVWDMMDTRGGFFCYEYDY